MTESIWASWYDIDAAERGTWLNWLHAEYLPWLRGIPTISYVRPESAPGVTGTLACDDMDHMVARIDRLTRDPAAWLTASQACRRHFDAHHTMEAAVDRYLEVFDRVQHGSRAGASVAVGWGGRS